MSASFLAHAHDPDTSHRAVPVDGNASLKDALLVLLSERPRTADELTSAYVDQAEVRRWPLFIDMHNIKRRLSELHTHHHVVGDTGERRPSRLGKASVVWQLIEPLPDARLIVKGNL